MDLVIFCHLTIFVILRSFWIDSVFILDFLLEELDLEKFCHSKEIIFVNLRKFSIDLVFVHVLTLGKLDLDIFCHPDENIFGNLRKFGINLVFVLETLNFKKLYLNDLDMDLVFFLSLAGNIFEILKKL